MCLVANFNDIYYKSGFDGVVEYLENNLQYGYVERKTDDLVMISTKGWGDNEDLVDKLTSITCRFGEKHYVGYLRGGYYYFSKDDTREYVIAHINTIQIKR